MENGRLKFRHTGKPEIQIELKIDRPNLKKRREYY